jgi:hypothetical protein
LTLHLNLALIAGTICKMEQRELEVTHISAQGLKNVRPFGMMTPYAVVWVYSNMKVSTPIDPTGSVNPTWNAPLKLIVERRILEQPNAKLEVHIYDYGSFSNQRVGSCSVPLSHFQEMDSEGADTQKSMSFLVRSPSGETEWMLHLALKLGDVYQLSAMPGPSSAVAHTVEPPDYNPIMAYSQGHPNGYNQAGGSQYPQYPPQYHPQYPQYYPPVMPPPAPYYQPPGQYAVPPPPQRTGSIGRHFVRHLLDAVRTVLVVAELDDIVQGGDGGDDGLDAQQFS